jgi:DNA-binding NarL/FixJ family response regulator
MGEGPLPPSICAAQLKVFCMALSRRVLMPGGMDGIETTRRILERAPTVKVIALSASMDEARMMAVLRAGAVSCIRNCGTGNAAGRGSRCCARQNIFRSVGRPASF